MKNKIVIAGGSGTIGAHLIEYFASRFSEIVVLSRAKPQSYELYRTAQWNAKDQGPWTEELEDCELVINLTGQSIQTRFTEKNKSILLDSRIDSTRAIGQAIKNAKTPPKLWINASGSAIYPLSHEKAMDEKVLEVGTGFKAKMSEQWEKACTAFELDKTRKVIIRLSPVLSNRDGILPPLKRLSKFGLGGAQGSGQQMVSWIHHTDLCRAVEFILDNTALKGAINLTAPHPERNAKFMKTLRQVMSAPLGLPAPSILIQIGTFFVGIDPALILESTYVVPKVLLDMGFIFEYPHLKEALEDLV